MVVEILFGNKYLILAVVIALLLIAYISGEDRISDKWSYVEHCGSAHSQLSEIWPGLEDLSEAIQASEEIDYTSVKYSNLQNSLEKVSDSFSKCSFSVAVHDLGTSTCDDFHHYTSNLAADIRLMQNHETTEGLFSSPFSKLFSKVTALTSSGSPTANTLGQLCYSHALKQ